MAGSAGRSLVCCGKSAARTASGASNRAMNNAGPRTRRETVMEEVTHTAPEAGASFQQGPPFPRKQPGELTTEHTEHTESGSFSVCSVYSVVNRFGVLV